MKESKKEMTAKQLGLMFVFFFIANFIIIYLANALFPANVVLGTFFHTKLMALVYSVTVLTIFTTAAAPIVKCLLKKNLTETYKTTLAIIENFASVWVVARLAAYLGMGINSWVVAFIIGVILGFADRALVKTIIEKA